MTKNDAAEETYFQMGWYDRATDKQLSRLATNGILKIKDRTSVDQLHLKAKKMDLQNITKQIVDRMKMLIEWETNLVLCRKLNPKLANVHAIEHPVINDREKFAKSIWKMNEKIVKPKPRKLELIKVIEQTYCEGILTDTQKLGIEFKELTFGESYIYDYYRHGKLLKKKMYQYTKSAGLHLPRSKQRIKINDVNVEIMKNMKINNEVDYNLFHNMTRKIINEPFNGNL